MYICVCNGITEEDVQSAVASGHRGSEVLKKLGVGDNCGICLLDAIEKVTSQFTSAAKQSRKEK